jgi:hypothetical protein
MQEPKKKKKKLNLDCPANKDLMMMGELRKKNTRKGIDGYDSRAPRMNLNA